MKNVQKFQGQLTIAFTNVQKQDVEAKQSIYELDLVKEISQVQGDRFRALLNASEEVLYRMSSDWREVLQFYTVGFFKHIKRPTNNWFQEYIPQDDQRHVKAVVQESIRTKSFFELEHRIHRTDGSLGWVFSRAVPVLDENDKIIEWFGVSSDITDHKRTIKLSKESNDAYKDRTKELKKSELKYRQIIETSQEGIWIVDKWDHTILINPRMAEMLGCSIEEMMGRSPKEFIAPEFLEKADNSFNDRVYSLNNSIDYRFVRKDGSSIWCLISACSLYDDRGKFAGYLAMITDITDRKKAEEELHNYQKHLEKLVKKRTIELEIKSKKLEDEMVKREAAEEEKRRVEAQLAQAQRIEALDRFAGGIAHDMNNILSPIIINTEELIEDKPVDMLRHELLCETLTGAYRLRDLVKKILSFCRRNEQVYQPIRIKPLLEETVRFLTSLLPSTIQIQQIIKVKNDTVIGDPVQIQQVIMNLCKNAADALEKGKGSIEIELTNTHLTSDLSYMGLKDGKYLQLSVKDTGSGMTPDVMERIFDPFFTTKGVGKGTGMGLSIAYGIIKSHGGAITVESQVGKGSRLKALLPTVKATSGRQVSQEVTVSLKHGKGNILLVETDEIIFSWLQRILSSFGYRVTALTNGLEAFRLFNERPNEFDLVVTDLTMPEMTGLELARKLQKARPDIPIILLAGYNDAINEEEAKSFGIKDLLLKPVGTSELRKAILRIMCNGHDLIVQ